MTASKAHSDSPNADIMKRLSLFLLAALSVQPAVWAETLQLRNTAGNNLSAEIVSTESGQLTFKRTADDMEFTIPLSMLDKPSQKKIAEWEQRTKYQPDSAPFFKLGDLYVVPVDIKGNTITYFGPDSQRQEVNHPDAQKLLELVVQNKKALSINASKGTEHLDSIRSEGDTTLVSEKGATAIYGNGANKISLWKDALSSPEEPLLHEISYEIFLPRNIKITGNHFGEFLTRILVKSYPNQKELEEAYNNGTIQPSLRQPLPATLSSGKWIKNKAIIRTHRYAFNGATFENSDGTPIAVRNMEFKPIKPAEDVITLDDLKNGYNLFTSNQPFQINNQGEDTVEITATSPLQYSMVLDLGYEVEIEIEYENGQVTADADYVTMEGKKDTELLEKIDLKNRKESLGSRSKMTITFNTLGNAYPQIFLKSGIEGTIKLHRFDVSIKEARNAAELNILHR
jgi:hypothetical protein